MGQPKHFLNNLKRQTEMATEKTFAVAGVSTLNGKTKIRFANDAMRVKILAKNGHTGVDLVDLPREMTKAEIAQHLFEIDFAKGRIEILDAIKDLAKKNKVKVAETKTAAPKAKAAAKATEATSSAELENAPF
jgi:hypothetical protein